LTGPGLFADLTLSDHLAGTHARRAVAAGPAGPLPLDKAAARAGRGSARVNHQLLLGRKPDRQPR